MKFTSINPFNNEEIASYTGHNETDVQAILERADDAFHSWRETPIGERARLMHNASVILRNNVQEYAVMITREMGKPITESRAEIRKCATVCDYYAKNAAEFLAAEQIESSASQSFVRHDPIGCVLAIMPWNYPFWQVFRFAAPTLMAGNTALLKHAPNVFGCAKMIESVFREAGFPKGIFQNLIVHQDQTEAIIASDVVKAVSLTGSERAGSAVAAIAGRHLKKCLLELGGSNAFIVWEDADLEQAVQTAVQARMLNCGQSCIAAKRFILVDAIYKEFADRFTAAVRELNSGDPMNDTTQLGVMARLDLADELQKQVQTSMKMGAEKLFGGSQNWCDHEATVIGNVTPGMPAFDQETFGPLAALIRAKDEEHAFQLAEQSKYGLGVTICTSKVDRALEYAGRVSDGALFINELVKSDPRLPFGGTKRSGYGRELSKDGILEFVNRKTIYVK